MRRMSIYLIYGENRFRAEEALKRVLIKERIKSTHRIEYDCSSNKFNMDIVFQELLTISLFGTEDKKCVIVRNPWFLKAGKEKTNAKDSKRDAFLTKLESYLSHPNPDAVCVFFAEGEIDARKKETKLLKEYHAEEIVCKTIPYWEFPEHIKELLKKAKIAMSSDAYKEFELRVGTDEYQLHHAIDKLLLYGEKKYDLATIQKLIPEDFNLDIWKLGNALVKGDYRLMDEAKNKMFSKGNTLVSMIPLLSSQLMRSYNICLLSEKGLRDEMIATRLRTKPYAIKMQRQSLYRRTSKQLLSMMVKLAQIEFNIKSGIDDGKFAFERFLLEARM